MSDAIRLDETARRMMDGALRRGVKDACVAATRSRAVSVTWRTGRVDKIEESARLGVSLDLYIDGKYTTCTTNDLRPDAVDAFLDAAVALCRAMTPDPFRAIPDPALYAGREDRDLGQLDPAIAGVTTEARKQYAQAVEAAALARAGDKAIQAETGSDDGEDELFQIHSNGFEGTKHTTYFDGWASVSLQDAGDKRPEGDWDATTCRRADLPAPEVVGTKAADYGLLRLGAAKVPTAKLTMLVENRAVGRIFGYLLAAATGRALQQKQSFLDGMLGRPFASAQFDLRDDPFVPGGLGSRLFDGEGITAKPLPLFEQGVLRNFFIDTYYGRKLAVPPTTAGRSNLVLTPGTKTLDELVQGVQRGILVRGFIGGNSNATTGDFSTGIFGTLIEHGALTRPVAEMNVAGNHKEFWKHLAEVGNDPWPYGSTRVPSLLFEDVQFSGQ